MGADDVGNAELVEAEHWSLTGQTEHLVSAKTPRLPGMPELVSCRKCCRMAFRLGAANVLCIEVSWCQRIAWIMHHASA
jgi:hypothetical protein